jgi:hypothetical protein
MGAPEETASGTATHPPALSGEARTRPLKFVSADVNEHVLIHTEPPSHTIATSSPLRERHVPARKKESVLELDQLIREEQRTAASRMKAKPLR